MTLFTANGLLVGETRGCLRGIMGSPSSYVAFAYQDWYLTQTSSFDKVNSHERFTEEGGKSWLLDIPELYAQRAPGNTCMSALSAGNRFTGDYNENPINSSKGCGGIMRVAPIALKYRKGINYREDIKELDKEGALKYQNDFSKAIIVSVNHNGDSDSTGAVTGNILGALVGYDAIESKWKNNLELHDVILEIADDLCHGCNMGEYGRYRDPAWISKYVEMRRYKP